MSNSALLSLELSYGALPSSLAASQDGEYHCLVASTITAPSLTDIEHVRGPVDLLAVVDTSKSMSNELYLTNRSKLARVRACLEQVVPQLNESDRFGIVLFAQSARALFPLTPMDRASQVCAGTVFRWRAECVFARTLCWWRRRWRRRRWSIASRTRPAAARTSLAR